MGKPSGMNSPVVVAKLSLRATIIAVCGIGSPNGRRNSAVTANQSARPPTIDAAAGYKGVTGFIVEKDFPGFSVGKKEDKLGIRASSTCELILEDCRVPKENVLGQAGKGYKIAIETLNEGRIGIGAQMIGLARGAWEARWFRGWGPWSRPGNSGVSGGRSTARRWMAG